MKYILSRFSKHIDIFLVALLISVLLWVIYQVNTVFQGAPINQNIDSLEQRWEVIQRYNT